MLKSFFKILPFLKDCEIVLHLFWLHNYYQKLPTNLKGLVNRESKTVEDVEDDDPCDSIQQLTTAGRVPLPHRLRRRFQINAGADPNITDKFGNSCTRVSGLSKETLRNSISLMHVTTTPRHE